MFSQAETQRFPSSWRYRGLAARVLAAGRILLGLLVAAGAAAQTTRPNVLLLVAEDLSPRIGAFGDTVANTPNLDVLAKEGVRYTNVFTTAGVCAPSRAALVTGLHQMSFGAQHMRTSTGPLGEYYAQPAEGVKAFPELLRRAGYYTFTDTKLDYQFSGIRAGSGPFTIWDAEGVDAGWQGRAPGQPFFGLINFMETHESGVMRADGTPHSETHARTQRFRAAAGLVAEPLTSPDAVQLPPYYPDLPEVRADLARHYDNIHRMDARVGRILRALESEGLADTTVVIWTTDHGDGLPRAKRELFDSGLHVPMILRSPSAYAAPGYVSGGVDDRLVSFVDLAPTILTLAGVTPSEYLHGHSLLDGPPRRYVYAARDRIDEVMDRQRAVRDGRFKYVRSWHPDVAGGHALEYRDNLDMVVAMRAAYQAGRLTAAQARWFEPAGAEQLYDLSADPFEVDNLVGDPSRADTLQTLRQALDAWMTRVGDTAAVPEAQLRQSYLDDGRVPVTPAPQLAWRDGRLQVSAAHGASVGYRLDEGPWRLYTSPIALEHDARAEVRAVRYGWRVSELVTSSPGVGMRSAERR